ncbi:hypothetical protein ACS5UA_17275 [Brucella sp. RRSP16]|uniref:hypothetical protein n=1 Tax=Brucella TaxID=234 RepID=UPI001F12C871|nr:MULTISPECIES: hypothetical protein [Brucella]MCH6205627.1 hypothetical protein [Brucella ciceri]
MRAGALLIAALAWVAFPVLTAMAGDGFDLSPEQPGRIHTKKIVEAGPPSSIFNDAQHPRTREFLAKVL